MIKGIDKYFKPIVVQRFTETLDGWNNPVENWTDNITVMGLIRKLSGNEVNTASKDLPVSSHRLYCRVADIKVKDRVVYKDELLSITSVNNVMDFNELLQVELEYVNV